MTLTPFIVALGLVVFLGASFFFALAETALFTLGKWQARQLAEHDAAAGGLVANLLANPQDLLATIVLGNTVANAGLVIIGLWTVLHESWPVGVVVPVLLLLILVGGEVVPKTLAVRVPERWARRVARPMSFLQEATAPLHRLAQQANTRILRGMLAEPPKPATIATAEDYTELLDLACQQGALGKSEREIILQILSLDRRTAKDVMQPRARMACLPDDLPLEEMVAAARQFKHRRLPLYDGTPDTIVGVLNTRILLLDPHVDLAEAIEFPSFVPESINLLLLLKSLQRQQRGLAIVLDEYGTTAGLVTMEDILGSLIGGIRTEGVAEGFVMEKLGERRWRVNGTMRLEDFRREYTQLGEVPEVDTMGGLMVARAEVVPTQGQTVMFRGLRLTALAADERRVRELLVEVVRKTEGSP